jgi:hypothetical protein
MKKNNMINLGIVQDLKIDHTINHIQDIDQGFTVMSDDVLERLRELLSQMLSDEQVQSFMAELTTAFGERSVAIRGDATNATIFTGNQTGATAEQIRSIIQELLAMQNQYPNLSLNTTGVNPNTEDIKGDIHFRHIALDPTTIESVNAKLEIIQEIYQAGYLPTTYQDELQKIHRQLQSFSHLNHDLQRITEQSDRLIESAVKAMKLQLDVLKLAGRELTERIQAQASMTEMECQQEMARIFQIFINRLEDSRVGAEWIVTSMEMLINNASHVTFRRFPDLSHSEQVVDDFKFSLKQFLDQVIFCL